MILILGSLPRAIVAGLILLAAEPGIERDVKMLAHVSLQKRMRARVRVLKAGPKAVPALIAVLGGSQKDPYKRHAALYLLGEIGDRSASNTLLRIAGSNRESERQRFWALSSLGKIREERAIPLAREFLASDSEPFRRAALWLILGQPSKVSVPILLEGLRSEKRTLRTASVQGLRRVAGEKKRYDPEEEAGARKEAILRWEEWWEARKTFSPEPIGPVEMSEYPMKGCTVWTDRDPERAKEIGEKVAVLRKAFAGWFGVEEKVFETRVREFQRWEDFQWYGSMNQWGFQIVSEFFYSPFLHEVVTYDTGEASLNDRGLVHEVFHDFYHRNADTQLPWFNEGFAEYFETWLFQGKELQEGPPNREWGARVRAAFAAVPQGILSDLMELTQEEFYFRERGSHYAVSWAWVNHLVGTEEGRKDLRRVFLLLRKSQSLERIRKRVFGKRKLRRLEGELRESLQVP